MIKKILLIGISLLILGMIGANSLFILAQKDTQKETNNKTEGISPVNYTGEQYRDPLELPIALRPAIRPVVETVLEEEETVKEQIQITEREKPIVLPTFTIQGMVWGGVKPQALIDNQLCEKGDILRGAEITDITKEGVTFVYKDKKFLLAPIIELHKIAEKKDEYRKKEDEYRIEDTYQKEEEYQIEPIESIGPMDPAVGPVE